MNPLTVRERIAIYLRHAESNDTLAPRTLQQYKLTLGLFCDQYDLPVADLKAYMLTDFIAAHPGWRASGTKRRAATIIRTVFTWAADEERIERCPFKKVRYRQSEPRSGIPEHLLTKLIDAAQPRYKSVLLFLRTTGCRIGELVDAKWADVDLERGSWVIHAHKTRRRTGKPKILPLTAAAVELLRSVRDRNVTPDEMRRNDEAEAAALDKHPRFKERNRQILKNYRSWLPTEESMAWFRDNWRGGKCPTYAAAHFVIKEYRDAGGRRDGATPPVTSAESHIFRTAVGTALTTAVVRSHLWQLKRKLGITGFGLHSVRHLFAEKAAENGASLPLLAAALGNTTQTAAHYYAQIHDLGAVRGVADLAAKKPEGGGQ